jgi:hypothetical protein
MAPLLAILGAMLMAPAAHGWSPQMVDLQQWAIGAPILAMCVPSGADLKLSLKSWPILGALLVWFVRDKFNA